MVQIAARERALREWRRASPLVSMPSQRPAAESSVATPPTSSIAAGGCDASRNLALPPSRTATPRAHRRRHQRAARPYPSAALASACKSDLDHRAREFAGRTVPPTKSAGANLDVEHDRRRAGRDLLAHDRRRDERNARDRIGSMTQRIQFRRPARGPRSPPQSRSPRRPPAL